MTPNSTKVIDFLTVVRINEGIKHVVDISFNVNIVALNAMLRAKQAGASAAGFGVSSTELRRFSAGLDTIMSELSTSVSALVAMVAAARKRERLNRCYRRARRQLEAESARLHAVLERKELEMQAIMADVTGVLRRLRHHLARAEKMARMGMTTARASKIEAVYCNRLAADLKQVAETIEHTIDELLTTIKTISRLAA